MKLTPNQFQQFKTKPLVMATAYDFPFAGILEAAGVDVVLVGDSLANVVLGHKRTSAIGMDEMLIFVAAAAIGASQTHVTADMPFGSDATLELVVENGKRFMLVGADSVKIEGPNIEAIRALIQANIPVMGHLGVLPQTATSFRPVGKSEEDRNRLIAEAKAIEEAGAFAFVLENVEPKTAHLVSNAVKIPSIGIGSGIHVNGQVQVLHDLLGLSMNPPPFAKAYAHLREEALRGIKTYVDAVRNGKFP